MGRHLLVVVRASTFHVDLLKGRLAEHKTVAGFQVRSAAGLVTTRTLTLDFSVLSQDEPLPAASPAAATHNKRRFSVSSAPPPIAEVYDRVGPLAPFVEVFVVRIEGRNVHRDSRDRLQLWLNSVPACNELLVVMAHSHATSRKDTEKARKEMLVDCEGRHRIRDRILHLVLDADSHKDSQELWGAFGARLRDCLQVNIEQRLELLQLSLLHECRTYRVNHRWAVRLLNCLSTFTPIASCLETVENDRVTSLASNFERHCLLLQWVDAFACLSSQLGFVWESVLIKMLMAPGLPADDITLCQVGPPPTQPDAMCAVWKQLRSDESDPADFSFPPSRAGLLTLADSVLDVTQPVTPVANYFQWRLLTHWKATCELGKPCSDGVVSAPLFKEALPAKQHAGRLLYLAEARLSFLAGLELDLQSTDPPEEAYYLFIVLKVVLLLDAVHTIQDRLLAYREQDQDDGTSGRPAPPATMLSGHSLTLETTRETSRHAKSAEKVRGTRVYSLAVCRCLSACIQSWSQLEHLRSPTPPENSVEIRPPRTKCTLEEALSLSQDPTSRTKFLEFLRTQLKLYADHANLCRTSHMLLLQYGVSCPSTPVVKPGQGWERVQRVESRKAQKSEGASDRLKLALLTEIAHERRDPSDLPPELKHEWKVDLDAVVEWYAEPMDVLDEKDVGLAPQTPVPCDKGTRTVRFIGSKDTDSVIAGFHSGCVPAFSPLLSELQHRLIKRARVPYALYKAERVQDADVYLPAESCDPSMTGHRSIMRHNKRTALSMVTENRSMELGTDRRELPDVWRSVPILWRDLIRADGHACDGAVFSQFNLQYKVGMLNRGTRDLLVESIELVVYCWSSQAEQDDDMETKSYYVPLSQGRELLRLRPGSTAIPIVIRPPSSGYFLLGAIKLQAQYGPGKGYDLPDGSWVRAVCFSPKSVELDDQYLRLSMQSQPHGALAAQATWPSGFRAIFGRKLDDGLRMLRPRILHVMNADKLFRVEISGSGYPSEHLLRNVPQVALVTVQRKAGFVAPISSDVLLRFPPTQRRIVLYRDRGVFGVSESRFIDQEGVPPDCIRLPPFADEPYRLLICIKITHDVNARIHRPELSDENARGLPMSSPIRQRQGRIQSEDATSMRTCEWSPSVRPVFANSPSIKQSFAFDKFSTLSEAFEEPDDTNFEIPLYLSFVSHVQPLDCANMDHLPESLNVEEWELLVPVHVVARDVGALTTHLPQWSPRSLVVAAKLTCTPGEHSISVISKVDVERIRLSEVGSEMLPDPDAKKCPEVTLVQQVSGSTVLASGGSLFFTLRCDYPESCGFEDATKQVGVRVKVECQLDVEDATPFMRKVEAQCRKMLPPTAVEVMLPVRLPLTPPPVHCALQAPTTCFPGTPFHLTVSLHNMTQTPMEFRLRFHNGLRRSWMVIDKKACTVTLAPNAASRVQFELLCAASGVETLPYIECYSAHPLPLFTEMLDRHRTQVIGDDISASTRVLDEEPARWRRLRVCESLINGRCIECAPDKIERGRVTVSE